MITDYELTLIHAIRYELITDNHDYKVTDYVASKIPKLSDECITTMARDIKKLIDYSRSAVRLAMVKVDWLCLKEQLEEEMGKRYGRCEVD